MWRHYSHQRSPDSVDVAAIPRGKKGRTTGHTTASLSIVIFASCSLQAVYVHRDGGRWGGEEPAGLALSKALSLTTENLPCFACHAANLRRCLSMVNLFISHAALPCAVLSASRPISWLPTDPPALLPPVQLNGHSRLRTLCLPQSAASSSMRSALSIYPENVSGRRFPPSPCLILFRPYSFSSGGTGHNNKPLLWKDTNAPSFLILQTHRRPLGGNEKRELYDCLHSGGCSPAAGGL